MEYDFSRDKVRRSVTSDVQGMSLDGPDGQIRVAWSEVTGAGVGVKRPASLINRLPVEDPRFAGLASVVSLAGHVGAGTDLLYVAFQAAGKGKQLYTLAIPTGGELRQSLVAELSDRLGARWIPEPVDMVAMRRRLGFANWWMGPVLLFLILAVVAIVAWWLLAGRIS